VASASTTAIPDTGTDGYGRPRRYRSRSIDDSGQDNDDTALPASARRRVAGVRLPVATAPAKSPASVLDCRELAVTFISGTGRYPHVEVTEHVHTHTRG
jgi:hypothetical protein